LTRYYYTFTLGLLFLSYSVLAGPFIFLDKSGVPSVITQKEIQKYNQTHPNSILPLWELGGGIVRTQFPDYPGSDFNYNITLPFPAAIYRGDILRAERDEGIRGRFWNHKSFELDLSFDGTLPSRSGKPNPKRAGMPQLETVIEFGPKLIIHLLKTKNKQTLDLNLAGRFAFSTSLKKWQDQGVQFNPFISYKIEDIFTQKSLFMLSYSAKWSSRKLMRYYYQVAPSLETPQRPQYHAKSGLLETSLSALAYYPIYKEVMIFGGIIKAFYDNASNRQSPLLPKDRTTSVVLGIYLTPFKSRVYVED